MPEAGRSWSYQGEIFESQSKYQDYTYGFNGMQRDNATSTGSGYTTLFREYDPEIARWKSLDPKLKDFPSESPFSAMGNNPIMNTDVLGDNPLKADKARVVFSNGALMIRLENCHGPTQSIFYWSDPSSWKAGKEIGRSTYVSTFTTNQDKLPPKVGESVMSWNGAVGAPIPSEPVEPTQSSVVNNHPGGNGSVIAPVTKGLALMALFMETANFLQNIFIDHDNKLIKEHSQIAKEIQRIVKRNINLVPKEYRDARSLSEIANVIMTGENFSKDPKIKKIGDDLYRKIFKEEPVRTGKIITPSTQTSGIKQDNTEVKRTFIEKD